MKLPKSFLDKMQQLLGDEYNEFLASYTLPIYAGLRVNTSKITPEVFKEISPVSLEPISWVDNGFYYSLDSQPAKHPYYYAGLYYIQEPSAMIPASLLPIEQGDKVLDLCAAPGGKSTELGSRLRGTGLLVSNDISNTRAKALLKNIELHGIKNAIVMSEAPEKLENKFSGYFDKILVDAPCSGEGMFRKDPSMIKSYMENGVDYYSRIQKNIILSAAKMLKPGGMLLYSTCTFSPEENEETIQYLLEMNPEFSVVPVEHREGFSYGRPDWINGDDSLKNTIRIWPHKTNGEGHYAALLKKKEEASPNTKLHKCSKQKLSQDTDNFLSKLRLDINRNNLEFHDERLYLLPEGIASLKGLHILRSGLYLGDEKKNRFEPSQALANALKSEEFDSTIKLSIQDDRVLKYLKGETIEIEDDTKSGWQLVCVDDFPLGWGKATNGTLKNKYYAGWRWM